MTASSLFSRVFSPLFAEHFKLSLLNDKSVIANAEEALTYGVFPS